MAEVFWIVRGAWREVLRLCRTAGDRSQLQRLAAFVVSVWTLWWIGGQFAGVAPSALEVFGNIVERLGFTELSWGERVASAWARAGSVLAVLGGLLWAATSEQGQVPALLGWVAVMLGSQQLGYQPAVVVAVTAMVGFVLALWVLSLAGRRFVDRHPALLPKDVCRAGVTAATLSAVVPLYAPAFFVFRLLRPYLTRAPRLLPAVGDGGISATGGWTQVPDGPDPAQHR